MNGGGSRAGDCRVPSNTSVAETVAMVVVAVVVFILPSLLPGPMIWLYGFHGTKRRRCVDYVLSKNFLFASNLNVEPCGIFVTFNVVVNVLRIHSPYVYSDMM
jgi:hypothetical protein